VSDDDAGATDAGARRSPSVSDDGDDGDDVANAGAASACSRGGDSEAARLAKLGVLRLCAGNAGPLTLSGTNTWVLGSDPAYVVDPGPKDERHLEILLAAIAARGGLGGVALTHDHADHSGALPGLLRGAPAPVGAGRRQMLPAGVQQHVLRDGAAFGPLRAFATPGHASDHLAFLFGEVCVTGDAVLGEGSVFLTPEEGALAGYIASLRRLAEHPLAVICPGHGPSVWEPHARLREYVEHRLDRERRLLAALHAGRRTTEDLLDAAWSEVPAELRPLAAITLAAHLDKLADEGRLPDGVQRPRTSPPLES
jgi:glyoxylase-like metal-dependent hydrolase (beta-lactamase superfamily II)